MTENTAQLKLSFSDTQWEFEYTDHDREIVRAIVFDDQKNLYFVRATRDDDFGKATLIETSGGGVEQNEDHITAIRRELKEELGACVQIVSKLSVVDDYYNLIHRHNINHYYLCKVTKFCEKSLTEQEINCFNLKTLKLTYEQAIEEYKRCSNTKIGQLIAQRELPVLMYSKPFLDKLSAK